MTFLFLGSCLLLLITSTAAGRASRRRPTGLQSNNPNAYFNQDNHAEYVAWTESILTTTAYPNSVYIPSAQDASFGLALHWKIHDNTIAVAMVARATGWMAMGLSNAGGMLGSDMAIWQASKPDEIQDSHVVTTRFPEADCRQDWTFRGVEQGTDFTAVQMTRALDTADPQDWAWVNDAGDFVAASRVIAAWGSDSDVYTYHGPVHVARGAVKFFVDPTAVLTEAAFDQAMAAASIGSVVLAADQYEIPTRETTYETFCFTKNNLIQDQGVPDIDTLNIVGFRPIVTEATAAFVHHFTVYTSDRTDDNVCNDFHFFPEMAYVWAPGEGSLALPDFLGVPVLGTTSFQSFQLEIHYDNPLGETNQFDSSGVEFFYSNVTREMEMGVLQVGDPSVYLHSLSVGAGLRSHEFECPGTCSSLFFREGPVTVIREYLHMHQTGTRMVNQVWRDGEMAHEGVAEVWEFDQSGNQAVQQEPYQLYAGDVFKTQCIYDDAQSLDGNTPTFGLASSEEMCMAFLFYYPRKAFVYGGTEYPFFCAPGYVFPCLGTHESTALATEEEIGRSFGVCDPGSDGGDDDRRFLPDCLPFL